MDLQPDLLLELTQGQVQAFEAGEWYHSIELPDGRTMPGIIPVADLQARFDAFGIPRDLRGKTVLDIGAATGWCSFEAEKRGATVLAVDCVPFEELRTARAMLGSKIQYEILDVEEITPSRVGMFDIVLFFGVLYHVRHPLLALENLCAVTRDRAFVESFVTDTAEGEAALRLKPTLEFYETGELAGQIDNWFGPSLSCLAALSRSAGFAHVEFSHIMDRRGGFRCGRHVPNVQEPRVGVAPKVSAAVNNRTGDIYFSPHKDEYISVYFDLAGAVTRENLIVEIDGFGAPVIGANSIGPDAWQANLRRPSGLAFGEHALRVRTWETPLSRPVGFVVGEKPSAIPESVPTGGAVSGLPAPEIVSVTSNFTNTAEFTGSRHEYISCFFRLSVESLDRSAVHLEVGAAALRDGLLIALEPGLWQINARMPPLEFLPDTVLPVVVALRDGPRSAASQIRFRHA